MDTPKEQVHGEEVEGICEGRECVSIRSSHFVKFAFVSVQNLHFFGTHHSFC